MNSTLDNAMVRILSRLWMVQRDVKVAFEFKALLDGERRGLVVAIHIASKEWHMQHMIYDDYSVDEQIAYILNTLERGLVACGVD